MRLPRSCIPSLTAGACVLSWVLSASPGHPRFRWATLPVARAQAQAVAPPGTQISEDELTQRIARAEESLEQARLARGQARATYLSMAQRDFSFVHTNAPGNSAATYGLAEVTREVGNMKEAETLYRRYIDHPDGRTDYRAYEGLGEVYLDSKYYRLALPRFKSAVQLNATSANACDGLARAFLGLNKFDEAYAWATKAHELDPNKVEILGTFVRTCMGGVLEDGRIVQPEWLEEGLRTCNQAIGILDSKWEKEPDDTDLIRRKSLFLELIISITQSQLRSSREIDAEKIIRLVRTRRIKQQVDQMQADHESLYFLFYALQEKPDDVALHMAAVELQLELSLFDAARVSLEAVLELQPNNQQARALLNEIDARPASLSAASPN